MSDTSHSSRHGLTVDSDWLTTFGLVILFVVCVMVFIRDADKLIWGRVTAPAHVQKNFWSISSKVYEGIAAILLLVFAFDLTQKAAKIACGLMGIRLAGLVLLSCFEMSASAKQMVAVSESIVDQMALVIFCVAIVQWLKAVVRRESPPESRGGDR